MPRKSQDFRAAVWRVLEDGQWHGILDLIQVGGVRAASRVHELRHEDGRRILNRVVDGKSSYRYVCDCGPLPDGCRIAPDTAHLESPKEYPETAPRYCERCRPALREIGIKVPEPAPQPESQPKHHISQLFLWGTP